MMKRSENMPEGYIIAIDFDGTLCESAYPGIGAPRTDIIEAAKRRKQDGAILVLWTCRKGKLLSDAVAWCKEQGIVFDAVNENIAARTAFYGSDPRKIGVDELWDDTAFHPERIARCVPGEHGKSVCSRCGSGQIGNFCAACGAKIV